MKLKLQSTVVEQRGQRSPAWTWVDKGRKHRSRLERGKERLEQLLIQRISKVMCSCLGILLISQFRCAVRSSSPRTLSNREADFEGENSPSWMSTQRGCYWSSKRSTAVTARQPGCHPQALGLNPSHRRGLSRRVGLETARKQPRLPKAEDEVQAHRQPTTLTPWRPAVWRICLTPVLTGSRACTMTGP